MSQDVNTDRRRLIGTAALALAAAKLGIRPSGTFDAAPTDSLRPTPITTQPNPSLGPVKQIDAGLLSVGYAEVGSTNGSPVILLHAWPYDIHSYAEVAPVLASAGYRVIIPYLRGYGSTRFLSSETVRNGQQSVVAVDILALMDALKIEKAVLASTGERGPLTSSLHSGRSAARRSWP